MPSPTPAFRPIWQPQARHALPAIPPGWLIAAALSAAAAALIAPPLRALGTLFTTLSRALGVG